MSKLIKLAIFLIVCLQLTQCQQTQSTVIKAPIYMAPSCPDCFVSQVCGNFKWTKWFDRDNPSGLGDFETIKDLVSSGGCAQPTMIECETTSGLSWWKTG
jgi:hypothetical protein